ncbi:MAG: endolytic transglycosylase MltG [Rubrivivax sp.]|nr:MAG: endolytic transglycosylase MltG [Rubrivivax sp.]
MLPIFPLSKTPSAWRQRGRASSSLLGTLVGLLIAAALAFAAAAWWWVNRPMAMRTDGVELAIETGESPREIARNWVDAGVHTSPMLLYQWFRWSGDARQIRAGSYVLEAGATPRSLLRMMVRGDERLAVVKLIDGWTFKRFRAELAQADGLSPGTARLSDDQLMAELGSPGVSPEGQFFPDTYSYSKGSADLAVLQRAHRAMQKHVQQAWTHRSTTCPLRSPQELLTLASIVEKETGLESDRAKIAAVFCNRLRIGMPLQTDPTVIYGLGDEFDGNLKRSHLLADTPYNTYLRPGLPPSPIAMPGKAALLATVSPAHTDALYFVARGDGSSAFSSSLAEHNRAVNQYQKMQRKQP